LRSAALPSPLGVAEGRVRVALDVECVEGKEGVIVGEGVRETLSSDSVRCDEGVSLRVANGADVSCRETVTVSAKVTLRVPVLRT
jgi:hypothetical protein